MDIVKPILATWLAALACWAPLAPPPAHAGEDANGGVAFFESKIRPLLVAHCYECHAQTAKQVQGGLKLDSRAGILQGSENGPVIIAGKPLESPLIQAIGYRGDIQMPPSGKLAKAEIDLLTEWVSRGAPIPADGSTKTAKQRVDFEAGKRFWSFQPPRRWSLPQTHQTDWPRSAIDHFVLAELDRHGLTSSLRADARTIVRRATFDLIGLPPTEEEVEQFADDTRPDALERVIDRLLASPHYGERWGRYWLDFARYADGNTLNLELRPHAWLYRDWVMRAFNEDVPYDRFVRRQLAADQMPGTAPADLAALGFLGISPEYWKELKLAPVVIEQIVADEWEERIDAIGRTFLGLSLACARCHDHKFDPISTEDYYALAGVLASTQLTEVFVIPEPEADVVRQAAAEVKKLREEVRRLGEVKAKTPEGKAAIAELHVKIKSIESSTPQYHSAQAHAAIDAAQHIVPAGSDGTKLEYKPDEAIDLCVQVRGNPARLGQAVSRRFLTVLSAGPPQPFRHGSGRLELAEAILREGGPLSTRVIVNRVWKLHFGRGLVETTSDFGAQGAPPSHPDLLDDLAHRFVEHGWSLKWLHRELTLSAAYQQASTHDAQKYASDPDNRWLWRMSRRRLDVEAWRDSLLAACGNLDLRIGGPSVSLTSDENRRRTLYGKIDRADLDDMLRLFDFPDPSTHSPDREPTTTALQQLFVLNSPFMVGQADALAGRLLANEPDDHAAVVRAAYRAVLAREPSRSELELGATFLGAQLPGLTAAARARQFAQALLGSNELLFVD